MNAEKYLKQYQTFEASIQNKIELIRELQETKADYRGIRYDNIATKEKSPIVDAMAEGVADRLEREEILRCSIIRLMKKQQEVIDAVDDLDEVNEYIVIYDHYIKGYSLEQIAEKEGYSISWAKKQREKGLIDIQKIIDNRGKGLE